MKKLPESELELMMIIWHACKSVSRTEIEEQLSEERNIGATTILSFLSRLREKGFLEVKKQGKNNIYSPIITEEEYLQQESGNILKKMYRNSIKNFVTSLYDSDYLCSKDLDELQEFLDEKRKNS